VVNMTHTAFRCWTVTRCWRRLIAMSLVATGLTISFTSFAAEAAAATSPASTTSTAEEVADALASVNYYRAMAKLPPVTINDAFAAGARNHSCYMLLNGMSHDEASTAPGYSTDGQYSGKHANIAVTSDAAKTADGFVELWMGAPFHAIGILRPNLTSVAYGSCTDPAAPLAWRKAATLDVLSNLAPRKALDAPIVWPGDGSTTKLNRFVVETPDPLAMCGWPSGGGLPVIAMLPESPTNPSATITGPSGPLEVCTLAQNNVADPAAKSILTGNNAVTVLPRNPLAPGRYTVTLNTAARVVTWSFTVDPSADRSTQPAPVPAQPAPDTAVIGPGGGVTPIAPLRIADTRQALGATRLVGGVVTRLQVTGKGTVPADANAASANFTVVNTARDGYLTAYACTPTPPTASTLNFTAGSTTPHAALIPLDAAGGLCVYTNADTDLVVDITGWVSPSSTGRFTPTAATRVLDTRIAMNAAGKLPAGQTLEVQVTGAATNIPVDATAVSINITAIDPTTDSYVTVYPCSTARPLASTLNPSTTMIESNSIIVGVSTTGTVCFYSPVAVDLVADVSGYVTANAGSAFIPLKAIRALDTRDPQPILNLGGGGKPFAAGSTHEIPLAGIRGIPANALVMSINITSTESQGAGYLTIWPCTSTRPTVSALNASPALTIANSNQAQLSSRGSLCVYTQTDTHLIIDINGYWK
jgi:uncharacterized protein YkwD